MKLRDLVISNHILASLGMQRMPGRLTYAISKNSKAMAADIESHNKARIAIIESHGYDNSTYTAKSWDQQVEEEYQELLEQEIEFTPYKVPIDLIAGFEKISPVELEAIQWMFEE